VVCRYGGEEFVILLPQTGPEQAFHVAEKLRHAVEVGSFLGSPVLTISGGVAVYPYHGDTRENS